MSFFARSWIGLRALDACAGVTPAASAGTGSAVSGSEMATSAATARRPGRSDRERCAIILGTVAGPRAPENHCVGAPNHWG